MPTSTKGAGVIISALIAGAAVGAWFINQNTVPAAAQSGQEDAIAIRVIPNPEHYSAREWYGRQAFDGSPQSMTVDGYEAVRDGRTVYVNAANIDGSSLFTNIYLISYTQSAAVPTIDIFGQILKNWRFNTNVTTPGACDQSTDIVCYRDEECPVDEFCMSQKAGIIRDTRRMSDINRIRAALERFREERGRYPELWGGTYLPHKTMSVWPSWQNVLAQQLQGRLPVDPINRLGDCGGTQYHPVTCWDEDNKSFPTDLGAPAFPSGSRVYFYSADPENAEFTACALIETSYANLSPYDCLPGTADNQPPFFTDPGLPLGFSGEPYEGYIRALDPDGDKLTWTWNSTGWTGWNPAPDLAESPAPNQMRLASAQAGNPGVYSITVTVDDGRGGAATETFEINISDRDNPHIDPIGSHSVVIGHDLSFTITASEPGGQYPLSFDFSGAPSGFNSAGALDPNGHDWHVSGIVEDWTRDYNVLVETTDTYGGLSDPVGFGVTVVNNRPIINSAPVVSVVGCRDYYYDVDATDPDGHDIEYTKTAGPADLSMNSMTGELTGFPVLAAGTYPVTVEVRDEYYNLTNPATDAITSQSYNLIVADEEYNVVNPATYDFYVDPAGIDDSLLHHLLLYYSGTASSTSANPVTWSLTTTPAVLPGGMSVSINSASGLIYAEAADNSAIDPAGYTFTLNLRAVTDNCNIEATDSFDLTVYPNEWCGDGVVNGPEVCDDGGSNGQPLMCNVDCMGVTPAVCGNSIIEAGEECESGGTGTGPNDQWDCDGCAWAHGWCGDGTCDPFYEDSWTCADCPLGDFVDFQYCTAGSDQPVSPPGPGCYSTPHPTPTLNWSFNSWPSELCDCDGIPSDDCPDGTPCPPVEQTLYIIQMDTSSDFTSPDKYETGILPVTSPTQSSHTISGPGLSFGTMYYFRIKIMVSDGTWGGWALCDGPFTLLPEC